MGIVFWTLFLIVATNIILLHLLILNSPPLPTYQPPASRNFERNGNYCVINNWLRSNYVINPENSITLVTQGSPNHIYDFIDVAERWDGPVSVAFYIDSVSTLQLNLQTFVLLQNCKTFVAKKVTFHIIVPWSNSTNCNFGGLVDGLWSLAILNCDRLNLELKLVQNSSTKSLSYPVNMARNVARAAARTKLQLVSDIELLPSPDFSEKFLSFHQNLKGVGDKRPSDPQGGSKEVFVIPVYEIDETVSVPKDRSQLRNLVKVNKAVPFHTFRAPECHRIPRISAWLKRTEDTVDIFESVKWQRPCWEPVFVSGDNLPQYDERFVGYGRNKIQQIYELCRQDYIFHVVDGLFLIHRKISVLTDELWRNIGRTVLRNNQLFEDFKREMDSKYPNKTLIRYCDMKVMETDRGPVHMQ